MRRSTPYLIAEIGVNYYDTSRELGIDPVDAAKLYIDKAAEAGIDCAKFQTYKASKLASKNSPAYWDLSQESTKSQYELFSKYDGFGPEQYRILSEYAHMKGIDFTSTPFDYEAADYLEELVDFYKISSSDITNIPFIKYIGMKGKPVVLSVGASYLSEVDEALRALYDSGCDDITILHCVLSYPTKPEDANLRVIGTLKTIYPGLRVGYSDHVAPDRSMLTLSAAYMMGAEMIEKHFTLDKQLAGNDHYHSGSPEDFKMAKENFQWIDRVMGHSEKTVEACEVIPRREARRSLVIVRDMKKGDRIKESDLAAKRPGTGISPACMEAVVGRTLVRDLDEDTILQWDMM